MSVAFAPKQGPHPARMQQRRCEKCGKLVSRAAYACRRCGKAQRIHPRAILLCLAGALLVAMFAVASASALPSGHGAESVARAAVPAPPILRPRVASGGHALALSATELSGAYARDPAAADHAYRDQSLIVTGLVRSVERNFEGDTVVRLGTSDVFDTVNATLATRGDPGRGSIAKGRTISLLCVGRGALIGAPLLESCFLR